MKFSLFAIAACVGPAFAAPTPTSPTKEILPITFIDAFLAQLPALSAALDKIEGSLENAPAFHAPSPRSVDDANSSGVVDTIGSSGGFDGLWPEILRNLPVIMNDIIEAVGPETNFDELWPEVLRNLPVIIKSLEDAAKDAEAGGRVRRAASIAGFDLAAIFEMIPDILRGITTLPAPAPTARPTAPVPGNGTQGAATDVPAAPTAGGLDIPAILESFPAIIAALQGA